MICEKVVVDRLAAAGFGSGSWAMDKVVSINTARRTGARYCIEMNCSHCYDEATIKFRYSESGDGKFLSVFLYNSQLGKCLEVICRFQASCGCGQTQ